MSDELDKALGELNDTYAKYRSPQVPKEGLPEEISKTPMPEASPGTKASPGASLDDLVGELNRSLPTPKPAEKPVGIPERKSWLTGEGHPLELGLGGLVQKSIQGLIQEVQNVPEFVGKKLGVPEFRGPLDVIKEQFEPNAAQKAGMEELGKTIPGQIAGQAIQAPAGVIPYMVGGAALKLLKLPAALSAAVKFMGIGGKVGEHLPGLLETFAQFGGVGAASRLADSGDKQAKGLLTDAALSIFFHYLGPLTKIIAPGEMGLKEGGFQILKEGKRLLISAPVMAAMFGGQALVETGDMKQAIAPAAVGAMLSIFSGGKGSEKGVYEKEGKGYKRMLSEGEKKAISDEGADKAWGEKKESYIRDHYARQEKEKAMETGRSFAEKIKEAEASWEESQLNKKREIAPGVEETEPGVKISDEDKISKLFLRSDMQVGLDELPEDIKNIDIGEVGLRSIENAESDASPRVITKMMFDPQKGEMSLTTPNGEIVYGKRVESPGYWAKRIMKDGVITKVDPHNATVQQVMDIFGIRRAGEHSDTSVNKANVFKPETIINIDTKVPVRQDIMNPKPGGEKAGGPSSPPSSALPGEGFKPNQDVVYKGEPYVVSQVNDDGTISIYKEGKGQGGSIRDVKPDELKAPETKLRVEKEGTGKEKERAIDEVIALEKELRDKRRSESDQHLRRERVKELSEKFNILNKDISERRKAGVSEEKLRALEAARDDEPITPKIADRVVQLFNDVAGEGVVATLTPEIKKDLAVTEALRRAGMTEEEIRGALVRGKYTRGTLMSFVEVVMSEDAPVSALHEIVHFLEDFKLMDTERNELKGWEPDGEKRAEKLANIMHRDLYGGVKSMLPESIRKIVVKLENFIKDFGKFLKGEGYGPKDVDKIIRDIETGEIGKRRVRETPLPQGLVPLELDTARDQIIRARGETEQTTDRGKTATKLGVSPEDLDYVGVQDFNNQRLHLWNLKKAVPGHPEGSTITSGEWYGKEATKLRVAKDVEKEIKDDLRGATKTMGGVTDALKRAFAPGTRGDIAKTTVTDMGRELARHERDLGVFLKATEKATRGFDRMSTEEQYQFSQNASTGKPQANGILDAIEDHVQRVFTDVGNGINKLAERIGYTKEDELLHMRDDYWPGVEEETWRAKEGVKPAPIQGSRVFEPTGFMKQKVFQDFNERIAAGYIPKDPNPIRGQALPKLAQESKVYYTYKMIADTMDNGNAVIIKPGESVEPGWRAVPGPYGNTKIGGKLIMTDQAAQVFENWLSRPLASNKYVGPIYKAYMNITTALQRAQLFGLFHGGFMVGESVTGTGALALKQAYRVMTGEENIGTFLKTAISVPFAPFIKYKMGAEIRAELETPGTSKDPRVIKAVEDIMRGGGGISQEKMFTNYWTESMKQSFKEGRNIAGAFKSPFAGMEFLMKPLMQKFVPNLKLGAFEELSNELQKAKPNLSDAAYNTEMREIWNRIDSRLGQVRWQRLFMNNTAKNLIQMIIRAPGWTGGTIMEIGGAPIDVFRFVREWQKTGRPAALPDRVAYVLSLAATTMVTNAALTCLFAKKNPNELTSEDYMAFQTGDIDERGKPLRGMLPLYSKDIYAYKKSFVSTLWHKTNPIIGLIYELTQNKDYYGTGIIDPTKGQGEKIGELGKYLAKSLIPFGYRGGAKISEERGVTPEGVLMPIVGIMPAPAYFSQSKATQKALEFGALKMPSGGRTQEDFERNKLLNGHVKRYLSAMSKGEPTEDVLKRLGEDVQSGKLKQQDIMKFKTKIKGQSLESSVTRLSIDQAMAVWRVATDEEKRKIVPLIFKKYRNLKDPRDKQEYASEMEKISGDLSKIYNLEK